MKKKSVVWLLAGFIILMIVRCGCRINPSDVSDNKETEITLSERQKNILAEQGLPTEYEQLSPHQQRAIAAIEEMLLYVEDKYGQSFSYAGYAPAGSMEKEHMQAYPSSGFMAIDCFTITKGKDGYKDDFLTVAAKPYLESYLYEHFQPFLPDTGIKLYAHITETSLKEVPTKDTNLDGKVAGAIYIFLDGETCPIENVKSFQTQVETFLYEHQLYGMVEVTLLKEGNFVHLSEFNFADYFAAGSYDSRETIYIRD